MENKYLDHILVMLQQTERKINDLFCHLTEEQLNWKPDKKSWSIAECIHHLNLTSQLYFGVFEDIKNNRVKSNFLTKIPFWSNIVGKLLLKTVDPDTVTKAKTPALFKPTQSNYDINILTDFGTIQRKLIVYIHEIDGYDHSKYIIPSPMNPILVYKLTDAMNIIWKHQIRHLNQANKLKNRSEFPKS